MKDKGERTKYPGVFRLADGGLRVRVQVVCPRTGKTLEAEKVLRGVTPAVAAESRGAMARELRDAGAQIGGGIGLPARPTLTDWTRSWLSTKAATIEVGTLRTYRDAMTIALDALGELFVDVIRPADVQAFVSAKLQEKHEVDGKLVTRYAPTTVHGWFRVLRTCLRDAVAQLDLARDPTLRVAFPDLESKHASKGKNALTGGELAAFLASMERVAPQHHALTMTLAFTGLRFCHASALKWEDVDEAASVIRVRRKQHHGRVGPVSRKKRAPSEFPLPPELAAVLRAHRRELVKAQHPALAEGWCFPIRCRRDKKDPKSWLRQPSSLRKGWLAALADAGLSGRFTPHGLRRTFTDLARQTGADGVVRKALTGHVTEEMVEHYSSVAMAEKRTTVASVVSLVRLPDPPKEKP